MKLSVFAACNSLKNPYMLKAETFKALFERAKKGGVDAIEYIMDDPDVFDIDVFQRAMEETQMDVSLFGSGFLAMNKGLSLVHPDKEIEKKAMQGLKKQIKLAAELGKAVNVGLLAGSALPNIPTRESECILVDRFREIAEYCEKINTYFTFEAYDKSVLDYAYGTDKVLEMVEKVNSKAFRLVIDLEHMYIEDKDVLTSIMKTRDYISVVHFIDSDHNPYGYSNGNVDFKQMMDALKLINYDGYLVTNLVRSDVEPEKKKDEGLKVTSELIRNLF